MRLFQRIWNDDQGLISSIESLFLIAVLVLGLIAGWTNVQNAISAELTETSAALLSLNQSYAFTEIYGCTDLVGDPVNFSTGSRVIDVTPADLTADGLVLVSINSPDIVEVDVNSCP